MKEVFNKALEELNEGKEFVVASVVKTSGSTPQKPGSKLLVKKDGKTICGYAATSKSTTILNYCGIN